MGGAESCVTRVFVANILAELKRGCNITSYGFATLYADVLCTAVNAAIRSRTSSAILMENYQGISSIWMANNKYTKIARMSSDTL